MSKIRTDIERFMEGPTVDGVDLVSAFVFPSEFAGFQGHFSTGKVLPGACQIQAVISTIEKGLQKPVALKQIVLAKYFAPVFPDDRILCTVSGALNAGAEFVCKARISRGEEKISEIKLQISSGGTV